jgi:hypothetical protein
VVGRMMEPPAPPGEKEGMEPFTAALAAAADLLLPEARGVVGVRAAKASSS